VHTTDAIAHIDLSIPARAALVRWAVATTAWTRITTHTIAAAHELKHHGLVDIVSNSTGACFAGVRDDAGILLNHLAPQPLADASPAEARHWATYRRQAREAGILH
jgi:hypothetical protein